MTWTDQAKLVDTFTDVPDDIQSWNSIDRNIAYVLEDYYLEGYVLEEKQWNYLSDKANAWQSL